MTSVLPEKSLNVRDLNVSVARELTDVRDVKVSDKDGSLT